MATSRHKQRKYDWPQTIDAKCECRAFIARVLFVSRDDAKPMWQATYRCECGRHFVMTVPKWGSQVVRQDGE